MLILASKSPARKALLAAAGLRFSVCPAEMDERGLEGEVLGKGGGPKDVARELACAKALAVAQRHPGALVIGADQVLALEHELLHKPADLAAARAQLRSLFGRTHNLHSGLALAQDRTIRWSTVETASLTMRSVSPGELDAILELEGDAILESVGGYRLEGASIRVFERIEGDYFTILGLPLLPLLAALRIHAPEHLGGFT